MAGQERGIVFLAGVLEPVQTLGALLTCHVLVVHIIGGGRDEDGGCGIVGNLDGTSRLIGHLAVALNIITQGSLQLGGDAFVGNTLDGGHDAIGRLAVGCGIGGGVLQRDGGKGVGLQADDDDAVGHRGEGGALIVVPVLLEGNTRQGRLQVEFSHVVGHLRRADACMGHLQTAQRQVFHAVRALDKLLVDEVFGLLFLALKYQIAYLLEIGLGRGAVVIVGTTRPE